MSNRLKKKVVIAVIIEIVSVILLGAFLTIMQTGLSVDAQKKDTKEKLRQMDEVLETAENVAKQSTDNYDEIYKSKVESFAYMAQKLPGFEYTDSYMQEVRENLGGVTNALIVDQSGNVAAKAEKTDADFTYNRYNQLRTVFRDGKVSEAFEVEIGGVNRRYYGARIDDQKMAVIEQDPAELYEILEHTSTWRSMLENVSVGLDGYTFAVSAQTYTFLYYPDEALNGTDALGAGIDVKELEDDNYTWMTVDGRRLYCGVKKADNAYIICAVAADEITASRDITVGMVLFIFFAVITLVVAYAVILMRDEERNKKAKQDSGISAGKLYFNKEVGRKAGTVAVIGLLCIIVISFYMQTLFSLSRQSMSNNQKAAEVQKTADKYDEEIRTVTEEYNERYLSKCKTASYILSENPQLRTRDDLEELSSILGVQKTEVFNDKGMVTSSNTGFNNFKLSDDPKDQSYEFNRLLMGAEYVIQEAQKDETSGEYQQYIGVALRDENGNADGFVQIAVEPSKLEEALSNVTISSVLGGVRVGTDGFAFAVDKKDKTFVYYPDQRLIGRSAVEYGMDKTQFKDGYSNYIQIGTDKYYASSLETEEYYVYVAIPDYEMASGRMPIVVASAAASLISLLLVFFVLVFGRDKKVNEEETDEEMKKTGPMIDVVMPDGSVRKTESAASRWANVSIGWDDKTPEQKISTIMRGILSVLAIIICIGVCFENSLFDSNSIFWYVLNGKWERGFNIFAVTASIMIFCVINVVTMILRKILQMLARTFGARGETVCRLLNSFIKYISVLAILYYCLALFGVDTTTLLASAGILSLIVGLGAKELVSDILAGLFIIFEGEFRVGDIVTIGDWRGTVIEIGIRTTKIEDASKNIKIFSNSEVSGVVNMTREHSFAFSDIGIEYGESLERVENILEKELPNIRRRIPAIQDGPFYKGVVELGESSVNIRVMAQCAETDRIQIGRDLNREVKLLFDKYNINIPFPQVVINQPSEKREATEYEKRQADKFNKEQKELAKDLEFEEQDH